MLTFIGQYFIYLVLASMCMFAAVLASVCLWEAIAARHNPTN